MGEIETAVNLLGLFDDNERTDNAYVVDVSNPVCPHCGARLVINDGLTAGEEDQLADGTLSESLVTGEDIMPLVAETAESIVDTFLEDDDADPRELYYIADPLLKSVVHRKAIELSSVLKNNYDIQISVELLELQIKQQIQSIVGCH